MGASPGSRVIPPATIRASVVRVGLKGTVEALQGLSHVFLALVSQEKTPNKTGPINTKTSLERTMDFFAFRNA